MQLGDAAAPVPLHQRTLHQHPFSDPEILELAHYRRLGPSSPPSSISTAADEVDTRGALADSLGAAAEAEAEAEPRLTFEDHTAGFLAALSEAVRLRVQCARRAAADPTADGIRPAAVVVLFSGGIDSMVVARLAHDFCPDDEPIDLSSVCFAAGGSADRIAARAALEELRCAAPTREWRLIEARSALSVLSCGQLHLHQQLLLSASEIPTALSLLLSAQVDSTWAEVEAARSHVCALLTPAGTHMDLNIGAALWLAAGADGSVTGADGTRRRYKSVRPRGELL